MTSEYQSGKLLAFLASIPNRVCFLPVSLHPIFLEGWSALLLFLSLVFLVLAPELVQSLPETFLKSSFNLSSSSIVDFNSSYFLNENERILHQKRKLIKDDTLSWFGLFFKVLTLSPWRFIWLVSSSTLIFVLSLFTRWRNFFQGWKLETQVALSQGFRPWKMFVLTDRWRAMYFWRQAGRGRGLSFLSNHTFAVQQRI